VENIIGFKQSELDNL